MRDTVETTIRCYSLINLIYYWKYFQMQYLRFEYLENICQLHSAVINFITLFFHSIKLNIKVTDREENSYFCCTLAVRLYNSSACETVRFCYTVGVAKHKTLLSWVKLSVYQSRARICRKWKKFSMRLAISKIARSTWSTRICTRSMKYRASVSDEKRHKSMSKYGIK